MTFTSKNHTGLYPIHVLSSPPDEKHELYRDKDTRKIDKQYMRHLLHEVSKYDTEINAHVEIDHYYRFTDNLKSLFESPHVHNIAFGYIDGDQCKQVYNDTGYFIKGISVLKTAQDVYNCVFYLLTHASIMLPNSIYPEPKPTKKNPNPNPKQTRPIEQMVKYNGLINNAKFHRNSYYSYSDNSYVEIDKQIESMNQRFKNNPIQNVIVNTSEFTDLKYPRIIDSKVIGISNNNLEPLKQVLYRQVKPLEHHKCKHKQYKVNALDYNPAKSRNDFESPQKATTTQSFNPHTLKIIEHDEQEFKESIQEYTPPVKVKLFGIDLNEAVNEFDHMINGTEPPPKPLHIIPDESNNDIDDSIQEKTTRFTSIIVNTIKTSQKKGTAFSISHSDYYTIYWDKDISSLCNCCSAKLMPVQLNETYRERGKCEYIQGLIMQLDGKDKAQPDTDLNKFLQYITYRDSSQAGETYWDQSLIQRFDKNIRPKPDNFTDTKTNTYFYDLHRYKQAKAVLKTELERYPSNSEIKNEVETNPILYEKMDQLDLYKFNAMTLDTNEIANVELRDSSKGTAIPKSNKTNPNQEHINQLERFDET